MVAKANAMKEDEDLLKKNMSARRREVLGPKRLLLFKWLLDIKFRRHRAFQRPVQRV
jgi:hypothetical protein